MTEDGPAPPALGVNENVAETPVRPATRSDAATLKVTLVTAPPIAPLDTAGLDTIGFTFVRTVILPAALAGPSEHPASVTVTAVPAESAAPVTAKTTDVLPGVCGVRDVPADDKVAVGVAEVEKKPGG